MKTTVATSAAALMLLGVILIVEAFRNPLTFYSMFDFGVFAFIVGLCIPFASEVEKMVESERKGVPTAPSIPRPFMAAEEDPKRV